MPKNITLEMDAKKPVPGGPERKQIYTVSFFQNSISADLVLSFIHFPHILACKIKGALAHGVMQCCHALYNCAFTLGNMLPKNKVLS